VRNRRHSRTQAGRGRLTRLRAERRLKNLEAKLDSAPLNGTIGIGRTRWATHGKPSEADAHPHASARVAVVHNAIIENFKALREELSAKRHSFTSWTDSEVAAFLVEDKLEYGQKPGEAAAARPARFPSPWRLI
jgi:glucosamine--fructose-6-phosphate aminotransferase (isomerizing)